MPDCGHYRHYRRAHASVEHFRGFVLTNCRTKFVCAQLEASGRTPSLVCTHAHAHRGWHGQEGHKEICGLPGQVLHTWPRWHHWEDVSKIFKCYFSLGTGKYGDLSVSPQLKCALFIDFITCLLCANGCPQASPECSIAWAAAFSWCGRARMGAWTWGQRQCWSALRWCHRGIYRHENELFTVLGTSLFLLKSHLLRRV